MKRLLFAALISICALGLHAQELKESCTIVESSIKGGEYYNFTISGDGFLSYNWGKDDDNFTTLTVDLSGVTVSKDYSITQPKLWINCINGTSCISEQGRIGSREGMYFDYSRTYLPANSEADLEAMYMQMNYLIKYATGNK